MAAPAKDPRYEYVLVDRSVAPQSPPSVGPVSGLQTGVPAPPDPARTLALATAMSVPSVGRSQRKRGKGRKGVPSAARFFNDVGPRPGLRPPIAPTFKAVLQYAPVVITGNTLTPSYASAYFALNFAVAYTEYTGLFDQYRIDRIECWLDCRSSMGSSASVVMSTAIDLDDANVPTGSAQVEAKQGSLVGSSLAGRYHIWQPHMAVAAYTGAFTGYTSEVAGWIDSGSPSVQHYGLKIAIDAMPSGAQNFTLLTKLHCTFRSPGL